MSDSDQQLIEKWSAWFVLGASVLFVVWFIVVERDGLLAFIEYLVNTVTILPDSIETVTTYYRDLPRYQLTPTVVLGGVFGAVLTIILYLLLQDVLHLPMPSTIAMVFGIAITALGVFVDIFVLNALLLGVLTVFFVSIVTQPAMRTGLLEADWKRLSGRRVELLIVAGLGAVGGVFGSQIFAYPLQHCTYASEAPSTEYQAGVIITLIGVSVLLLPLWTVMGRRSGRTRNQTSGLFSGLAMPAAFLFPTLLSLIVFLYYPAVQIVTTSLNQSNARIPGRQNFVCLQNYTRLFEDITYQNSFVATVIITIAVVFFAIVVSLSIAVLASQKVRGAYVYRTLLIWPYALSPVVAGVIFFTMFQQESGLINYVMGELFGTQPQWFTDVTLARIMVVFASVWNILGFNILFYIAGLQNIPRDLLEAAEIDGANRVQRFMRITFPLLSPFTFFLLVTNITYSFYGIYGVIDVLTDGGPRIGEGGASGATDVLIYRLYEGSAQAGASAAEALVLFVLIAAITVLQFGFVERRVTYAE